MPFFLDEIDLKIEFIKRSRLANWMNQILFRGSYFKNGLFRIDEIR